ncbi:MAG TPA: hypothetical protein VE173_04095 [Longimicrobiales bacterium]|nr:hypothetical protein [Longimicrobiales bacterium]
MTPLADGSPILTLEPLLEAVREGVEEAGWELSGLQKTTSYEFEGRWEGERTRSAYLFFHKPDRWEVVSVDVYLDETSRGLRGNLALVLDGPDLGSLGDPRTVLARLGGAASRRLLEGYRTPVTLRLRLPDGGADPGNASTEIRFKLRIPGAAVDAGPSAVTALATASVRAFESLVVDPVVRDYLSMA